MNKKTKKYLYDLLMKFNNMEIDFDDLCKELDNKIIDIDKL